MSYEVSKGWFGEKGWQRISFWRWLWMRDQYVTRVTDGNDRDKAE
jgi:hypothetical protein